MKNRWATFPTKLIHSVQIILKSTITQVSTFFHIAPLRGAAT